MIGPPGTIEVKGGTVHVYPPEGHQRAPVIEPGHHIQVHINGEVITEPTPVLPEDDVQLVVEDVEPRTEYVVEVSGDGMEAHLSMRPELGLVLELLDTPPMKELKPRARVKERPEPPEPTVEDMIQALHDNGVVYGVDESVLDRMKTGEAKGRQRVAKGDPMAPGVDGRVELQHAAWQRAPTIDPETGRADFFANPEIAYVNPGDVIALIHPSTEGVPGTLVTGEEITPPEPKEATVRVGDGAEFSVDGREVVATRAGIPEQRGDEFTVSPVYAHQGNVDLHTGNITFRGDVSVAGDVEEQLRIDATGDIDVRGNVIRAHLAAQGGIRVRGQIVGSKLFGGGYLSVHGEIGDLFGTIGRELGSLFQALKQLRNTFVQKELPVPTDQRLIGTLIAQKFSHVPGTINQLDKLVKTVDTPDNLEAEALIGSARALLRPATEASTDDAMRASVVTRFKEAEDLMGEIAHEPADVVIEYAQQTEVHASGNVFIQGGGAYHSEVRADGMVVVQKSFRGGSIQSGRGVYVDALGSVAEVKTVVHLADDAFARVRRVYPGVWIQTKHSTWKAPSLLDSIEVKAYGGTLESRGLEEWDPPKPPS